MEITYVIQKSRRRSISVSVMKDNRVLVKAPYGTTERTVQEFLLSKKDWITKHLEKQNREEEKAESLGLLSEDEIKQIKKQARKIIPQRVEYWANKIGVTYGRIAIRLQSSRWGSCSVYGNLNFNCLLVLMPPEIMDSVVVHELCHRRHMNHSKEFYAEIDRVFPDYKCCNKWLKDNGGVYLKRVSLVGTTV
ncbi:MAG: SprT family zinc-dependent metalloprotease [Treponema sp.]|nr:SprT family zinc-dependent metalloprotease [Treponema sp.]